MKIYISIILVFIPLVSLAQDFRFSVFADPQISWLKPEVRTVESEGVRGGYNIGFEMDNFFSENYAFSTGLSLNNLGGKLSFDNQVPIRFNDYTETINPGDIAIYKLQYINVPIGMKFTTREIGYTTIYAKLGLGAHFNIKSYADISSLDLESERLDNEIEFFNLSYHFGAGIHYSLGGRTALVCGIEYRHMFIDITTNSAFTAMLNSLSLRLGVQF